MDQVVSLGLAVGIVLGFQLTMIASQGGTKWVHICTDVVFGKANISCPEGSTFEMIQAYRAFRAQGCPDNLTDSVEDIADPDCYSTPFVFNQIRDGSNIQCNGSQVCPVDFGGAFTLPCPSSQLNNFVSVNYKCIGEKRTDPETTVAVATTEPTQPDSTTETEYSSTLSTTVTSVLPVVATQYPYTIPLAAGAGGAIVIIVIILCIVFCIWRNTGDEQLGSSEKRKESVSEVNMVKRDEKVKSAPRFKEENRNRPDINTNTFNETSPVEPVSSTMGPMGLYALPDKSHQNVEVRSGPVLPPATTDAGLDFESRPTPPMKPKYEKLQETDKTAEYENAAFDPDSEAEYDDDWRENEHSGSPKVLHAVRFAVAGDDDDDNIVDKWTPDDLSDSAEPREEVNARGKVTSALYAEVNKSNKQNLDVEGQ